VGVVDRKEYEQAWRTLGPQKMASLHRHWTFESGTDTEKFCEAVREEVAIALIKNREKQLAIENKNLL